MKDISRREVLLKTGVGFAIATLPISACTIFTNDEDIQTKDVAIKKDSESFYAYLSHPKTIKNNLPVLLIIHEIFGVHEHIKDLCRRFAKKGYLCIAPNFFSREGDVTKIKSIDEIKKVVAKASTQQVLTDIDATFKYVESLKIADMKQVSITGFCWGGRITWMYSSYNSKIKNAVAWYGKLTGTDSLHPQAPVDIVKSLKVPVLGLYAEKDANIPLSDVEKMNNLLTEAKNTNSKIILFKDTVHGFYADYRPSYNEKSAKEAEKLFLEWIK